MSKVQKGDLCMICRIPEGAPGSEHNGKYVTAIDIDVEQTTEHWTYWLYEPLLYCDWANSYYKAAAEPYLEPIKKFPVDELIETKEPEHV
jgi:hypothetical protein